MTGARDNITEARLFSIRLRARAGADTHDSARSARSGRTYLRRTHNTQIFFPAAARLDSTRTGYTASVYPPALLTIEALERSRSRKEVRTGTPHGAHSVHSPQSTVLSGDLQCNRLRYPS